MTTGNNIVAAERPQFSTPSTSERCALLNGMLDRIALKIDLTIKGYEERLTTMHAQNDELTERARTSEAKARDYLEAVLAMARVAGKVAENVNG